MRKRHVTAPMLAQVVPVDRHGGGRHRAPKIEEHAQPPRLRRHFEVAAVNGNKLVVAVIEAMPGQQFVGVRNGNGSESAVVESGLGGALGSWAPEQPASIERIDMASVSSSAIQLRSFVVMGKAIADFGQDEQGLQDEVADSDSIHPA